MTATLIDTRADYGTVFDVFVWIGLGVLVLFWVLIIGFAVRYRRRPHHDGPPEDVHENNRAEGTYVALLAAVAAFLVYLTFHVMGHYRSTVPSEAAAATGGSSGAPLHVTVTASRWNWRFDYPTQHITQVGTGTRIPTLVVPTGNVTFRLSSVDVIHAFFIPYLRFKRDAFPERPSTFTVAFTKLGFHHAWGECAQFCGLRHSYMQFNVDVRTPRDFARWAAARRGGAPQRLTPVLNPEGHYR